MPPGFPSDEFRPNKPPFFDILESYHTDPRNRWETLKLFRLLQWLRVDADDNWLAQPEPAAEAAIGGMAARRPGGHRYRDLLARPRISRVFEMLGLLEQLPANTARHIDDDWFGLGTQGGWHWNPAPRGGPDHNEAEVLTAFIAALRYSIGLRSGRGNPADWPAGAWPPFDVLWQRRHDNPSAADRIVAPINVDALSIRRPVDYYWIQTTVSDFDQSVAVGPDRIALVLRTPGMDGPRWDE